MKAEHCWLLIKTTDWQKWNPSKYVQKTFETFLQVLWRNRNTTVFTCEEACCSWYVGIILRVMLPSVFRMMSISCSGVSTGMPLTSFMMSPTWSSPAGRRKIGYQWTCPFTPQHVKKFGFRKISLIAILEIGCITKLYELQLLNFHIKKSLKNEKFKSYSHYNVALFISQDPDARY